MHHQPPPPPMAPPPMYGGQNGGYNNGGYNNGGYGGQQGAYGQPPQPMQFPCCPEDPNVHFCVTDPNAPPAPGQAPSVLNGLWQFCDATTWMVGFGFVLSVIGFGLTVGLKGDNLMDAIGASDAADLDNKVFWMINSNVDAWVAANVKNGTTAAPTTAAPPTTATPPTTVSATTTRAPTTTAAATTSTIAPPPTTAAAANTTTSAPAPTSTTTTTAPRTAAPTNASRRQIDNANDELSDEYPPRIRTKWQQLRKLLQATSSPQWALPTTAPTMRSGCVISEHLFGAFGPVCTEDSLRAMPMLMNQSRWLNFRGTLYFLAMICTLALFIVIVVVNKQQQFNQGGAVNPQGGYNAMAPQPYVFHGTPLYYTFRTAWGAVSIIVFFWMVTELYQYWWFINDYKGRTSAELSSFWYWFDRKFVPSTICVGIFLCWPIVHMCLELAFFILGVIPWYLIRQSCYPQLANAVVDPDKPFDSHSCCIRTDWFYMNFHQCHRLGFSEGMWQLWTGSREPFCRALECQPQAPGQYGGPAPGYGGGQAPTMGTMGAPRPGPSAASPQYNNTNNNAPAALSASMSRGDVRGDRSVDHSMSAEDFRQSSSFFPADGGKTPKKKDKDKKDKEDKKKDKKEKKEKKSRSSKSDRESD